MIVAELFLEPNELLVSIDGCISYCCIYRAITEAKQIRMGKIMYIKRNKEKINNQLQSLKKKII